MAHNKRSIELGGSRTSISIEDAFWSSLHQIAAEQGIGVELLIARIAEHHDPKSNLSSAVRVFVLKHYLSGIERNAKLVAQPGLRPEPTS